MANPEQTSAYSRVRIAGTLAIHLVALLILLFVLSAGVPKHRELVADLDIDIPLMTLWLVQIGDFVAGHVFLLGLFTFAADSIIVFVSSSSEWPHSLSWWSNIFLLVIVILLGLVGITLCLPVRVV